MPSCSGRLGRPTVALESPSSSIVFTMDRYGYRYPSDAERVQDAADAAFETDLGASSTPSVDTKADHVQTGA
jgi:hypothetical protein